MGPQTNRELAPEGWAEYLDAVSRELVNAPVSIEVIRESGAPDLHTDRLALRTVIYDHGRDTFDVAAIRPGVVPERVLLRHVDHPARIEVDSPTLLAPLTIAVQGDDGVRTVVRIEREAERQAPDP
jgi:hypothetical protein